MNLIANGGVIRKNKRPGILDEMLTTNAALKLSQFGDETMTNTSTNIEVSVVGGRKLM